MLRWKSEEGNMIEKNVFNAHQKTVRQLSEKLNEPEWLLNYRLNALKTIDQLEPPKIERVDYLKWDLWSVPKVQKQMNEGNKWSFAKEEQTHSLSDDGVLVLDFEHAVSNHEDLFKKIYKKSDFIQQDNLFNAFTMAFLTDSLFVYIPENLHADKPLELSFILNNKTSQVSNRQVLIYAAANSSIEIIEKYFSRENEMEPKVNIFIQIMADVGAKVQYSALDQFGKHTTAFIQRAARTKKDAVVNWALGAMNSGNVIENVYVNLDGQGSSSDVKTVAITHDNQVQGININVTNIGSNTVGNIFQHGVALDKSTLSFNGVGHILRDSKNSDAQQESRVLMLSDDARADANPILLIDEYEVQAGHAASVSRVDQEQLYYLMSRGLEQKQAEKLMIRGFLGIVLSEISLEEVRQELIDTIERKLAQYGN